MRVYELLGEHYTEVLRIRNDDDHEDHDCDHHDCDHHDFDDHDRDHVDREELRLLIMFDQPVGWQKVLFHHSVYCIFSRQDS